MSPVFRLDLQLQRDDVALEEDGAGTQAERLEFSMSDDEILEGFSKLVDRLVCSFDDFVRPEFCKISQIADGAFEAEWADVAKTRRAAKIQQRRASFGNQQPADMGPDAAKSASVPQDFESLLYPDIDIGPDVYRKFMGRLQVQESDKLTKGTRKEHPASLVRPDMRSQDP